jgi:hypothetical protein
MKMESDNQPKPNREDMRERLEKFVEDVQPWSDYPSFVMAKFQDEAVGELEKLIQLVIDQALAEQREEETVVCSAVMADDGSVYRGHRHGHCFQAIRDEGKKEMHSADSQGFVTTRNRFVTRKEARSLQDAAGIQSVDKDGYRYDILFSEDLYQRHKDGILSAITESKT